MIVISAKTVRNVTGFMKDLSTPTGLNEQDKWELLMASIRRAANILGIDLTERAMPDYLNWFIGRDMSKRLWNRVKSRK